jgi:hypothetical protein
MSGWWGLGAIVMCAACSFSSKVEHDELHDAAPLADAGPDAPIDGPKTCSIDGLACAATAEIFTCNGACWASCPDRGTQISAAKTCSDWGGKLAPLPTQADHECAQNVVFAGLAGWIGLEQAASTGATEAGWSWNNDGVPPAIVRWGGGQPNDNDGTEDGNEQCAYISTSGTWHDQGCTVEMANFACRR